MASLLLKMQTGVPVAMYLWSLVISPLPVPLLLIVLQARFAKSIVTYTAIPGQTSLCRISGTAGTDYTLVSGGNGTSNTAVVTWLTSGTKTVTINYADGHDSVAENA